MQSPAAVALRPRLTAILRLDKPLALSRNTSRIFRMGSLSWGMPSPFERRASNCRFEPYPTGVPANTPQPRRHQLDLVAAINWNHWSSSVGTGGRHHVVCSAVSVVVLAAKHQGSFISLAWTHTTVP